MTDPNDFLDDQPNENQVQFLKETFNLESLFLIQFKEDKSPKLFIVVDINSNDNYFTIEEIENRENVYYINFSPWDYDIILKNDKYQIHDLIKVKEIKKDKPQELEDFIINTETIDEKEKTYSVELLKDDLLSQLIQSFNCYDNPYLINLLTEKLNYILEMIDSLKKNVYKQTSTSWLIPITDDKIKLYNYPIDKETMQTFDDGHMLSDELFDENKSNELGYPDYQTMINSHMKHCMPLLNNNSIGYITNEYYGNFLRNCIQSETCYSVNGNYSYDERKTGKPVKTSSLIINEKNEYLTEFVERHPTNPLNIIGYLQEPINKNILSFEKELLSAFSLNEKCLLNHQYEKGQLSKRKHIKKMKIINHLIDVDSLKLEPLEDIFISHTFNRKMNPSDLEKTLIRNLPTSEDILKLLLTNVDLSSQLLNYQNIRHYLYKYNIHYSELSFKERRIILNLLRQNVKAYIQNYIRNTKQKLKKPLKSHKKILSISEKIDLAQEYILSIKNENEKLSLLKQFIDEYTRKSDKLSEDSNFLYSKIDDKPLLCKHYLYLVQCQNENDIFNTMISLYGSPPQDGSIYCKCCGEYLCPEEESTFDGFDDDNNVMQSKEVIDTNKENEIDKEKLLNKKEDIVKYIELITNFIGVSFTEDDIYELLLLFDNMNQDELAELRYSMKNVSDSDIHPIVQDKIKKLDKKDKKNYKKQKIQIIKDFQSYLKNTNKLLMLVSLISLYIQTNLPAFQIKKTLLFEIMNFKQNTFIEKTGNYLLEKLKKICETYSSDKYWNDIQFLLNEKDTTFLKQLEKTLLYCMSSNFMKIKKRIKIYQDYLFTKSSIYYKQEWSNFKPLQNNTMIQKISKYLNENTQKELLTKYYNSYQIENISLIRDVFSTDAIADILQIDQVSILNNESFRHIFRYAVGCYGKTSVNIYLNLTFNRLLKTADKSDDILKILKKYQWNESLKGFKLISFFDIRRSIIPEILSLYNSENNEIQSCYNNESLCNHFIHNSINNFDLKMLNAYPKRHYYYRPPKVFPDSTYKETNKDFIDTIFSIYQKDSLGNIIRHKKNENYLNRHLLPIDKNEQFDPERLSTLNKTEENYLLILESIRYHNNLTYIPTIPSKINYTIEEYNYINELTQWNQLRFISYLNDRPNPINEKISSMMMSSQTMDVVFSDVMKQTEENIDLISTFLAQSDEITEKQKRRFGTIYKNYETSQKVVFKSEQLKQILTLFFMDEEFHTDLVLNYFEELYFVFVRIINSNKFTKNTPKEWALTDTVKETYLDNYDQKHLFLHNRVFLNTRDNYQGFNNYIDDSIHILSLFNNVKELFTDIRLTRGNRNGRYNERYSNIYSHYLLTELFIKMIEYIEGLKDEQSDIANDANDLFLSLEVRDDTILNHSIQISSQYLMDSLTHLLLSHYDPSWLYICSKELELSKGLSKQKEKEKQNLIDELDQAGKDKDELFLKKELNKNGQSQYWKEASQKYSEFTKSEEHATMSETERKDRFKEIFGEVAIDIEEINISVPQETEQELGYDYYEDKDNEDDEVDNLDEELDGEFNE